MRYLAGTISRLLIFGIAQSPVTESSVLRGMRHKDKINILHIVCDFHLSFNGVQQTDFADLLCHKFLLLLLFFNLLLLLPSGVASANQLYPSLLPVPPLVQNCLSDKISTKHETSLGG